MAMSTKEELVTKLRAFYDLQDTEALFSQIAAAGRKFDDETELSGFVIDELMNDAYYIKS
jgi:hypothetical protein